MSYCSCKNIDYDQRFKISNSGVVHAAYIKDAVYTYDSEKKYCSAYNNPAVKAISIACSRSNYAVKDYDHKLQPKTTTITCKQCQKAMGFMDEEPNPVRYVLRDNKNKLYYKKQTYCGKWVAEITNATLYNTRAVSTHAKRYFFYNECGEEITMDEYNKLKKLGITGLHSDYKFDSKRYSVIPVTLVIGVAEPIDEEVNDDKQNM